MRPLRFAAVEPLDGFRLRLRLTDGSVVERDVGPLLRGPVFEQIRNDPSRFRNVRAEHGTVVFTGDDTGDVDLCPDTILWGGLPPKA